MADRAWQVAVEAEIAVSCLWNAPAAVPGPPRTLILAHGAGNDMRAPFMREVATGLAALGVGVVRFNFPYKEAGRRAPDPMPRLERTWEAVYAAVREDRELNPGALFTGGKSMGGRVASHLAAGGADMAGLVFLGYPLHPAGRPERLRAAHLAAIRCPMLFVQGSRDPLCRLDLLAGVLDGLEAPVTLHVVEGGDHSFRVLKRSGRSQEAVMEEVLDTVAAWTAEVASGLSRA